MIRERWESFETVDLRHSILPFLVSACLAIEAPLAINSSFALFFRIVAIVSTWLCRSSTIKQARRAVHPDDIDDEEKG